MIVAVGKLVSTAVIRAAIGGGAKLAAPYAIVGLLWLIARIEHSVEKAKETNSEKKGEGKC